MRVWRRLEPRPFRFEAIFWQFLPSLFYMRVFSNCFCCFKCILFRITSISITRQTISLSWVKKVTRTHWGAIFVINRTANWNSISRLLIDEPAASFLSPSRIKCPIRLLSQLQTNQNSVKYLKRWVEASALQWQDKDLLQVLGNITRD